VIVGAGFAYMGVVIAGAASGPAAPLVCGVAFAAIQNAQRVGRAGEAAVGIVRQTARIPSLTGTAAYRVPDILNHSTRVIGEVKNVSRLSYTSQLRDYSAYASQKGYSFELWLPQSDKLKLSSPLQQAIANGEIVPRWIK
jgi:hypothetical protein